MVRKHAIAHETDASMMSQSAVSWQMIFKKEERKINNNNSKPQLLRMPESLVAQNRKQHTHTHLRATNHHRSLFTCRSRFLGDTHTPGRTQMTSICATKRY